jgi:hypothetical protein
MVIERPEASPQRSSEILTYMGQAVTFLAPSASCRYLGVWGTPTGDLSDTKARILKRTEEARDLLRHHPLAPEQAVDLFTSIGIGAFRYSAALVPWTERELHSWRLCGYKPSLQVGVGPTMDYGVGSFHTAEWHGIPEAAWYLGAGAMPPPATVPQARGRDSTVNTQRPQPRVRTVGMRIAARAQRRNGGVEMGPRAQQQVVSTR